MQLMRMAAGSGHERRPMARASARCSRGGARRSVVARLVAVAALHAASLASGASLGKLKLSTAASMPPLIYVVDDMPQCPLSALVTMTTKVAKPQGTFPSMHLSDLTIRHIYRARVCAGDARFVSAAVAPAEYCQYTAFDGRALTNVHRANEDKSFAATEVAFDEHAGERVAIVRWKQLAQRHAEEWAAVRGRPRNATTAEDADIAIVPSLFGLCYLADASALGTVTQAASTCLLTSLRTDYWDRVRERVYDGLERPPIVVVHVDWPFKFPCAETLLRGLATQPPGFRSRVVLASQESNLERAMTAVASKAKGPRWRRALRSKAHPAAIVSALMKSDAGEHLFKMLIGTTSTGVLSGWTRSGWEEGTARELARRRRATMQPAHTGTPIAAVAAADGAPLLVTVPYSVGLEPAGVRWDQPSGTSYLPKERPILVSLSARAYKGNRFGEHTPIRSELRKAMAAAGAECTQNQCFVCAANTTRTAGVKATARGARRSPLSCGASTWADPWNVSVRSAFCAEPPGDTPTRSHLSIALLSGCVPVIWDGGLRDYGPTTWWPWRADPAARGHGELNATSASANLVPEMLDYTKFAVVLDARHPPDVSSSAWLLRLQRLHRLGVWAQLQRNGQRVAHLFTYGVADCPPTRPDCDGFGRLYSIVRSLLPPPPIRSPPAASAASPGGPRSRA